MSTDAYQTGKKWINAFLAIMAVMAGYVIIRFFYQIGEWFDLEAKISNFQLVAQGLGVVIGTAIFLVCLKSKAVTTYLGEVYGELQKVVWPDSESVTKLTIGIVVALCIVSAIFVTVDYIFSKLLDLVY